MALQGTLDTFALADLVRLLATTSKTGELVIEGDRGTGRMWFADGILVGGEPAGPEGTVDALFALLRFEDGGFAFESEVPAPGVSTPADALDVLAEAEARIEAWRPIEAVVPSPAVALTLRGEMADDEILLDRSQWHLVTAIAGGATAATVAEVLDLDEVGAATRIKDLVDLGILDVDADVDVEDPSAGDTGSEDQLDIGQDTSAGDTSFDDRLDADIEAAIGVVIDAAIHEEEESATPELLTPTDEMVSSPETEAGRPDGPGGAPRPTLRSLSRPEPGSSPATPAASTAAPLDADPTSGSPEPSPNPAVPWAVDRPESGLSAATVGSDSQPTLGGSMQVDLDAELDAATEGHRYLGTEAEVSPLPEPLPTSSNLAAEGHLGPGAGIDAGEAQGASSIDPDDVGRAEPLPDEVASGGAGREAWPGPSADDEGTAGLEALSPAAARAVAAASSSEDDDDDAGRRVLRRIISTGKG